MFACIYAWAFLWKCLYYWNSLNHILSKYLSVINVSQIIVLKKLCKLKLSTFVIDEMVIDYLEEDIKWIFEGRINHES